MKNGYFIRRVKMKNPELNDRKGPPNKKGYVQVIFGLLLPPKKTSAAGKRQTFLDAAIGRFQH